MGSPNRHGNEYLKEPSKSRQSSKGLRESLRSEKAKHEALAFFGVARSSSMAEQDAWNQRRLRMAMRKFGSIKKDKLTDSTSYFTTVPDGAQGDTVDGESLMRSMPPTLPSSSSMARQASRQTSLSNHLLRPQSREGCHRVHKKHAFIAVRDALRAGRALTDRDDTMELDEVLEESVEPPSESVVPLKPLDEEIEPPEVPHVTESRGFLKSVAMTTDDYAKDETDQTPPTESKPTRMQRARRFFSTSMLGRILSCTWQVDSDTKDILKDMDNLTQYRPYFTYWICFVQLVVFIAAVSGYGFAPFGVTLSSQVEGNVIRPSLSVERVCRVEWHNMWLGPRQSDLIRLGARYAPCMRVDINLKKAIFDRQVQHDRESGCCIRSDGSGCYQSSRKSCSLLLASWIKWPLEGADHNRKSGAVCGQDPDYCVEPRSEAPSKWPDDVTKWPICIMSSNASISADPHMKCEVTARPCCVGIKGECVVTTKEHCDFLRGYYHTEANLCSQVNCLNEICGMLKFLYDESPDQFYRVFTSLFLHAGVFHLVISLAIQLIFMRDLEKLAGWVRVSLIYLLSGCLGNIVSGIFLPYQVEAGPTGSHFALLGMTFVEFIQNWSVLTHPSRALVKYLVCAVLALLLGLLPWVDNYAHITGFVSGVLLTFILLPFVSWGGSTDEAVIRRNRIILLSTSSGIWLLMAILACLVFYKFPLTKCDWCKFLNCVPLAPKFCDDMDVNVTVRTTCFIESTPETE